MIFSEFEKYQIVFWITVLCQKFKPRSSEKRRPILWKGLQQRESGGKSNSNKDNEIIEELGLIKDFW